MYITIICLFTTQNHIYWWWFSQQQPSIFLYHLHPVTWCFCSPLEPLIFIICLCTTRIQTYHLPFKYTTHIQLFLFLFHGISGRTKNYSHVVSLYSDHAILHLQPSIRQSYNFIMFKHPWQYPTQCIFPPLNSLTNIYTHYPWVYSLSTVPT